MMMMCTVQLARHQPAAAHAQLLEYQQRYATRLKAGNLRRVNQLLRVLRALVEHLALPVIGGGAVIGVNEFLFARKLDNVNLFELLNWLSAAKLVQKLGGFVAAAAQKAAAPPVAIHARRGGAAGGGRDGGRGDEGTRMGAMQQIVSFVQALTSADGDGRILTAAAADGSGTQLRFILLNPLGHFGPVLRAARAVVFAGGTMAAPEEMARAFFPRRRREGQPPLALRPFACSHVVPPENLACLTLQAGPSGRALDLSASARADPAVLDELGAVLAQVCVIVPGGVVAFFPSYSFEDACHRRWAATGLAGRLRAAKPAGVFREGQPAVGFSRMVASHHRSATLYQIS
jgi:chromosome transmission fidelity protein 1